MVQLREANITAKRDAYNRSVDASLLIEQLELANPDLACALLAEGPEQRLELSELRAMRYLELNLDLHERLWQQHQEGIFGDEEWEPWQRWFRDGVVTGEMFPAVWAWDRDYYQDDFAGYVDEVVAEEVARRAAARDSGGRNSLLTEDARRLRRHAAGGHSGLLAAVPDAAVIADGIEDYRRTRARWRWEPAPTRPSDRSHSAPGPLADTPWLRRETRPPRATN